MHIKPFAVCINYYKEHLPKKRTCVIYMVSLPVENLVFAFDDASSACSLIPPFSEKVFAPECYKNLCFFYRHLYPEYANALEIPRFYERAKKSFMFRQPITSMLTTSEVSNVILAIWPSNGNCITNNTSKHVGQIQYFLKHSVSCNIKGKVKKFQHVLAYVQW